MASSHLRQLINCRLFQDGNGALLTSIVIDTQETPAVITSIGPRQELEDTIDCCGCAVLPPPADSHTHDRRSSVVVTHAVEDHLSIQHLALRHGILWIGTMANPDPPICTRDEFLAKCHLQAHYRIIRCRQWFGATKKNWREMRELACNYRTLFGGVKVCMAKTTKTGAMLVTRTRDLHQICALGSDLNFPVLFHAEEQRVIDRSAQRLRAQKVELGIDDHCDVHSTEAETVAIARVLDIAERTGCWVHICHVSSDEGMQLIIAARHRDVRVTWEICPHHWLFTAEDLLGPQGARLKVNPAIKRGEANARAMRRHICNADLAGGSWATDHAPHSLESKRQPGLLASSGMPGLEGSLAWGLRLVERGDMSHARLLEVMVANPTELLGNKHSGVLEVGGPADLIVVDLMKEQVFADATTENLCGWTPYGGKSAPGQVMLAMLDGECLFNRLPA